VTSTRYTLRKLGLGIVEDWTPWLIHPIVKIAGESCNQQSPKGKLTSPHD